MSELSRGHIIRTLRYPLFASRLIIISYYMEHVFNHLYIFVDCQLMRCTLKILNIVYPNLMPQSPATKRRIEADPMRRKRAKSHTKTSPTHSAFHSEETTKLDCNVKTPERLDTSMEKQTSKKTTQNGSRSKDDSYNKHEKDFDKYEEEGQSVYDEEMLRMLYEIIQVLLVDVLTIIERVRFCVVSGFNLLSLFYDVCVKGPISIYWDAIEYRWYN